MTGLTTRTMRLFGALVCLWGGLASSGCVYFRAPVPMTSKLDKTEDAKCLLVFLPGAGDDGSAYTEQGFVQMVRAKPLSVDIVSADATLRYYLKGSVVERLDTDVIGPVLRDHHYSQVWLVGISMGGFGTQFYSQQRPGQIDGVLALAPFLGEDDLVKQIAAAGGLAKWTPPPAAPSDKDNYQAQLWRWEKETKVEGKPGPITWLGVGTEDSLAFADGVLAATLPADHVLSAPGKHEWKPWQTMFTQFLERSEFSQHCAK